MKLYLYETACDLSPLDDVRFHCDLFVGGRTIRERAESLFRAKVEVIAKARPAALDEPAPPARAPYDAGVFCPANLVPRSAVQLAGMEEVGVDGERIVFLRLHAERAAKFDPMNPAASAEGLPRRPMPGIFVDRPWDIIRLLPALLKEDAEDALRHGAEAKAPQNVAVDAAAGPVAIWPGAVIEPFAFIAGPSIIGPGAVVKAHSQIRASAVNRGCRVGGELNSCVLFPYSNKQHHGFLGHSIVGSWVNIGAGATGSNLKNTYGEIRIDGEGTGLNYLGQIIGDHTKIGIQAVMNTGSVYGICSNVTAADGAGVLPKRIGSFVFGKEKAEIDAVIRTCRIVMSRRGKELSASMETLLRALANAEC